MAVDDLESERQRRGSYKTGEEHEKDTVSFEKGTKKSKSNLRSC